MVERKQQVDGIVSMSEDARFVGNGMEPDGWTKAVVWSSEPIEVEESVDVINQYTADGTAPAVTATHPNDVNVEIKDMQKYELER